MFTALAIIGVIILASLLIGGLVSAATGSLGGMVWVATDGPAALLRLIGVVLEAIADANN